MLVVCMICVMLRGMTRATIYRASVTLMPKPAVFRGTRPRACRLLHTNPRFLLTDDDAGKKLLAWDTARGDALFVGEFWDDTNWWDAAPGYHHLLPGMEPHWSPDGGRDCVDCGCVHGVDCHGVDYHGVD